MWKTALKFVETIIFPEQCISCKKVGQYICDDCLSLIEIIETPVCPYCHLNKSFLTICEKHKSFLDGAVIACDYSNKTVSSAIKLLKYEPCAKKLAPYLSKILLYALLSSQIKPLITDQIVCFAPIHKSRENTRGFNQSQLIANLLAKQCQATCLSLLKKTKPTLHQTKLSKEKRLQNVMQSISFDNQFSGLISQKTIFLVDDVFTTGATMEECAKVLKQNGAKRVIGLAVAGEVLP